MKKIYKLNNKKNNIKSTVRDEFKIQVPEVGDYIYC